MSHTWTPDTLLFVNREYDSDRASDGYSRYGVYIGDREDSFVDVWRQAGPLDPHAFTSTAWRIAADQRIMSPGLVWLRDDITSVDVQVGGQDQLTVTVTVPIDHGLLSRRPPFHWRDWQPGWGSSPYQQYDAPEPVPGLAPTVLLTAEVAHAGPWKGIPTPTHTSGRGLVEECIAAVENLAEQINTEMGPLVSRLLGGRR